MTAPAETPSTNKLEADLLGFVHLIPERARERIIDIASTQFPDGSAYHQYQPLTKQGNLDVGSGFNDDPLWLIAAVAAYIKETGDYGILEEQVPFDCKKGSEVPLFEHLDKSFHYTVTHLGPHKLPLIGRADWNDCLNLNCFSSEPGESFQTTGPSEGPVAESVFIAGMFVKYGKEFEELCRRTGHEELAAEAEKAVNEMSQTLLGIQLDYDGLIVDPCLPGKFGDFKVDRRFRNAEYHIEIHKPEGVQKGVSWIEVDGEKIAGNQIPLVDGKKEYHVIVQMG